MSRLENIRFALLALVLLPGLLGAAAPPLLSEEVSGYGQSEPVARQDALDKARERIVALLKDREPNLHWQPTAAYIAGSGLVRDMIHVPDSQSERVGPHHVVTVRIQVTEQDVRKMLQQDRLQQRHLIAAKLLAALVVLLAALAAFFRLEDLTRGYYTTHLRMGLALCATIIAVGLWLVW